MKIKEVQAGVKIVKNYNSYQISLTADLDSGETSEKVGNELIDRAKKIIEEKINLGDNGLVEVGAAWMNKKALGFFSVKFSKDGKWVDVRINDLKKIKDGYVQETDEGVFIFKKISDEKRLNNKMPLFRIYKEVKNERN